MFKDLSLATEQDVATDARLWRAVIATTIQEWLSKHLTSKRAAERYLFENSADLSLVCESAGIDVGRLRSCLNKVRGRSFRDLVPSTD